MDKRLVLGQSPCKLQRAKEVPKSKINQIFYENPKPQKKKGALKKDRCGLSLQINRVHTSENSGKNRQFFIGISLMWSFALFFFFCDVLLHIPHILFFRKIMVLVVGRDGFFLWGGFILYSLLLYFVF